MKLRIKGNSIRLRLSQPELEAFLEYGSISEVIEIPGQPLVYSLERCGEDHLNVSRVNGSVRVGIPGALCDQWGAEDQVGYTQDFKITPDKTIKVTVEKDWQCLKPREGEDESTLYPNPQA